MSFARAFLEEAAEVLRRLDVEAIERLAELLAAVRERGGRLFLLGVGGGAANASHATNDFRKLAGFEAYCPTDNVAELTARTNDEGWETVFESWLRASRLRAGDALLIFSVGGGDRERGVSVNLIRALELARSVGASTAAIVGREQGYAARAVDVAVVMPPVSWHHLTPHTEAFQALIWHLLVSHPRLKAAATKW